MLVPDNVEDPKTEVARVVADCVKYSDEYFHIVGIKEFPDGVTGMVKKFLRRKK